MPSATIMPLSKPIKIGDLELRNRNVMASLTRNRGTANNAPSYANVGYYVQRARSAGLINTEGILTSPQGTNWPFTPGIWTKEHIEGWKNVTAGVHAVGGKIISQLWNMGRIANEDMPLRKASGRPVPGPSAIKARGGEGHFVRFGLDKTAGYSIPTPIENPWEYIEEFRTAAINAKEAGFDGVELHASNGYLVHAFMDNTANKRTDEWGGSVENRCRFALEALMALVEVWGPGRVGIKLSPCGGYNNIGMPLEDTLETFGYLITEVCKLEVAYIQIAQYLESTDPKFDGKLRGTNFDVVEAFGATIKNSPKTSFILNAGLTPDEANRLIESGKIDAAAFGFMWIGNPDLQDRIEKGQEINFNVSPKTFYASPDGQPHIGYSDWSDFVAATAD